jgi:hypothetical protein
MSTTTSRGEAIAPRGATQRREPNSGIAPENYVNFPSLYPYVITFPASSGLGDAGAALDATAKAQYKRRLADLGAELELAEQLKDRAEPAKRQRVIYQAELAAAVGLRLCWFFRQPDRQVRREQTIIVYACWT